MSFDWQGLLQCVQFASSIQSEPKCCCTAERFRPPCKATMRQWLAIIGVDQAEIDDICEPLVDLDLAEELEELSAAIRMSK